MTRLGNAASCHAGPDRASGYCDGACCVNGTCAYDASNGISYCWCRPHYPVINNSCSCRLRVALRFARFAYPCASCSGVTCICPVRAAHLGRPASVLANAAGTAACVLTTSTRMAARNAVRSGHELTPDPRLDPDPDPDPDPLFGATKALGILR
jgi:hypothetical protein